MKLLMLETLIDHQSSKYFLPLTSAQSRDRLDKSDSTSHVGQLQHAPVPEHAVSTVGSTVLAQVDIDVRVNLIPTESFVHWESGGCGLEVTSNLSLVCLVHANPYQ